MRVLSCQFNVRDHGVVLHRPRRHEDLRGEGEGWGGGWGLDEGVGTSALEVDHPRKRDFARTACPEIALSECDARHIM